MADVTSVIGLNFIDSYSQANAAFMVVTLKPFEERKSDDLGVPRGDGAARAEIPPDRRGHRRAARPAADYRSGLRRRLHLCGAGPARRRPAGSSRRRCAGWSLRPTRTRSSAGCSRPSRRPTRRSFSISTATRRRSSASRSSNVFQALQASLGGYFVNYMNLFGRIWQVQVQAEADDRARIDDIYQINVRSNDGKMIPMRSLAEVRIVVGPPAIIRYNNLQAVTIQGSPAPGVSSGQALERDGAGRGPHAPGGLWRGVDRHRVPGEARRRQDRDDPGLRGAVRVPVPGRALRKLDHSGAGAAVGVDRRARLVPRHRAVRPDARSLRADRHGRAHRPCGEERHPDRRVRQGASREGRAAACRPGPKAQGSASGR